MCTFCVIALVAVVAAACGAYFAYVRSQKRDQIETNREDLTRMLLHDLNNPVHQISLAVGLVEDSAETLDPVAREALAIASRSVRDLAARIRTLLDISRLESGKMELRKQPVAIGSLVRDAVTQQAFLAQQRTITLNAEIPDGSALVHADAKIIARVLQNLIANALNFTPAGGNILVSARRLGESVAVQVEDSGKGIEPSLLPRLFGKFARGDSEASGTGLGLAFCRLAVEAHDGSIEADNADGGGARFRFRLPIARDIAHPSEPGEIDGVDVRSIRPDRTMRFSSSNVFSGTYREVLRRYDLGLNARFA